MRFHRRLPPKGGTGCSAIVEPRTDTPLGPMVCGWWACGPHPDPAKSYREPLCEEHLAAAITDWEATA